MKSFVIGGLDTPKKKREAEAILKELGYESNEEWNNRFREDKSFAFIETYSYHGCLGYDYHNYNRYQPAITLEDLRIMKNQEK